MSKTTVFYKDVAVGAQEDAAFSVTGATDESIPAELAEGVSVGKVITLEPDRWALDGSFNKLYAQETIAFWSSELSDENGAFSIAFS